MSGGSAAAPYLSSCTVPSYLSTHFNFLHNAKEFVKTFDFDELVVLTCNFILKYWNDNIQSLKLPF